MTDADLIAVYDFETVIPTAVASVFTAGGFAAGTALTVSNDPEFQKKRPRVEIFFSVSGQAVPLRIANVPQANQTVIYRVSGYRGQLEIHAISDANAAGKLTHSAYRSKVRNFCSTLGTSVNGSALTKHKIQSLVEQGTELKIATDKSYERSVFTFAVDFSVQADAWAAINP